MEACDGVLERGGKAGGGGGGESVLRGEDVCCGGVVEEGLCGESGVVGAAVADHKGAAVEVEDDVFV